MQRQRYGSPVRAGRWRGLVLLAVLLAMLAALAWYWRPLNARALLGTSYAARISCSCRYVAGRALSECRKDTLPEMSFLMLSDDEDNKSVTARVLPFTSQTATFRQGWGCLLEPVDN